MLFLLLLLFFICLFFVVWVFLNERRKNVSVSVFILINPLMTGGPINELKAGHGVDYCRIFISGGDFLRTLERISK